MITIGEGTVWNPEMEPHLMVASRDRRATINMLRHLVKLGVDADWDVAVDSFHGELDDLSHGNIAHTDTALYHMVGFYEQKMLDTFRVMQRENVAKASELKAPPRHTMIVIPDVYHTVLFQTEGADASLNKIILQGRAAGFSVVVGINPGDRLSLPMKMNMSRIWIGEDMAYVGRFLRNPEDATSISATEGIGSAIFETVCDGTSKFEVAH